MFAAYKRAAGEVVTEAQGVLDEYETGDPYTNGRVREAVGEALVLDGMKGLAPSDAAEKTRGALVNALVFVVVGVIGTVIGAVSFASAPDTDSTTTGTVQQVKRSVSSSSSSKRTCSLIVSFTVGERRYTADSDVSSSGDCDRKIGDQVEVRYSAANPAENESGSKETTFGLLFGGVGATVALTGLWNAGVAATSVAFGRRLIREGAELAAPHPATPEGDAVVERAREKITTLLFQRRGGTTKFTPFASSSKEESGARSTTDDQHSLAAGPTVQPGWYPTVDGADLRWHDGYQWTEHTRPNPAAQPPAS